MEKNDIIKALYRQNPKADLLFIRDAVVHYSTGLNDGTVVLFEIPMEETKGADFLSEMDSKLLIRWIESFVKN